MSSCTKPRRSSKGCRVPQDVERPHNLAAIVRAYVIHIRGKSQDELSSFFKEPTISSAVSRAGLAQRPDGKRYDHQRRLRPAVLREAAKQLERANLADSADFDDLHHAIEQAIGPIPGIGELMVYDTSLRIGAKLGLAPKHVYLHSGTRKGARVLGLNWRKPYLEIAELPRDLRLLEPHEVEDCLCIYKGEFRH